MNKKITAMFTGILLFLSFSAQSQITEVPGAFQQPKWFMPFIIEDGDQFKDTIYLGLDPEASSNSADPNFGEIYTPITNASLFRASPNELGGEARKVEILDESFFEFEALTVNIVNARFPIKIYSDDIIRLHGDSLPFVASELNGPRAQLFIETLSGTQVGNPNHIYYWQAGVLFSDTILGEPQYSPVDTLIIEPWSPDTNLVSGAIVFTFTHWTGDCLVFMDLDEVSSKMNFDVFPNPTNEFVNIVWDGEINDDNFIELLDGQGRRLYEVLVPVGTQSHTLNLSSFVVGLYYVRVSSVNGSGVRQVLVW